MYDVQPVQLKLDFITKDVCWVVGHSGLKIKPTLSRTISSFSQRFEEKYTILNILMTSDIFPYIGCRFISGLYRSSRWIIFQFSRLLVQTISFVTIRDCFSIFYTIENIFQTTVSIARYHSYNTILFHN